MRLPSQISDHPESSKSSHPLIYSDSTDSLSQSSRLKYGFTSSKRRITQPGMRPNKVPSKKKKKTPPSPPTHNNNNRYNDRHVSRFLFLLLCRLCSHVYSQDHNCLSLVEPLEALSAFQVHQFFLCLLSASPSTPTVIRQRAHSNSSLR